LLRLIKVKYKLRHNYLLNTTSTEPSPDNDNSALFTTTTLPCAGRAKTIAQPKSNMVNVKTWILECIKFITPPKVYE
jgi:hypothetical protein